MAEIPVVIAHVQRVGPGTGIPTKTEQSDLNQWVFGAHGDFPRIVLAPGTLEECFDFTVTAFNLAESYQCPVVILTEEDMGQNLRTTPQFNLAGVTVDRGRLLTEGDLVGLPDFKRYALTPDGVSPRSLPSQRGGLHMVEGNEHDEKGYRQEDAAHHIGMTEKRMRKLESCRKDLPPPRSWGEPGASTGFVTTGSVVAAVLEAAEELRRRGQETKTLQVRTLWPFPGPEVSEFLSGCRRVFVVENNSSGQLRAIVRSQVCPELELKKISNYAARPFAAEEIVRAVLEDGT